MNTIINSIRWICGVTLCLISFGGFATGDIGFALFILTFGLLLLPTITKLLFGHKAIINDSQTTINQSIFNKLKNSLISQDQNLKFTTAEEEASTERLVNITSESNGNNSTEFIININEKELVKRVNVGNLKIENRSNTVEDIAGFRGTKQFSPNKQYCVLSRDGYSNYEKWENGNVALIKDNILLFKNKIQRPHDCHVSNDAIVICCDWQNSDALTGKFFVFDASGEQLFTKKTTANLGLCAISDDSKIAIFETYGSETNDSNKIFVVDIEKQQIINKFENPISFNNAFIDTDNNRIKLKNHKGFLFEIDFEGNQTNKIEYELQIMTRGSVCDKLGLHLSKPIELRLKESGYLELLKKALTDEDASYSFGKDKIYRMIGEFYEINGEISKTIESWEKAILINPKVGIRRKLETLKKVN